MAKIYQSCGERKHNTFKDAIDTPSRLRQTPSKNTIGEFILSLSLLHHPFLNSSLYPFLHPLTHQSVHLSAISFSLSLFICWFVHSFYLSFTLHRYFVLHNRQLCLWTERKGQIKSSEQQAFLFYFFFAFDLPPLVQ